MPILVTLLGMSTLVKLSQEPKAYCLILVILVGIVMLVRPQAAKVLLSILVTRFGMVILANCGQLKKASCPILVRLSGRLILVILVQ